MAYGQYAKQLGFEYCPVDYKDMNVFNLVAREGNQAAASRLLGISPPMMSFRMKTITEFLRIPLIEGNHGGGTTLTPMGDLVNTMFYSMLVRFEAFVAFTNYIAKKNYPLYRVEPITDETDLEVFFAKYFPEVVYEGKLPGSTTKISLSERRIRAYRKRSRIWNTRLKVRHREWRDYLDRTEEPEGEEGNDQRSF